MMIATNTTPSSVRERRNRMLLDGPFMDTGLTVGGAIITIAVAPIVWFVIILVWAALPA